MKVPYNLQAEKVFTLFTQPGYAGATITEEIPKDGNFINCETMVYTDYVDSNITTYLPDLLNEMSYTDLINAESANVVLTKNNNAINLITINTLKIEA